MMDEKLKDKFIANLSGFLLDFEQNHGSGHNAEVLALILKYCMAAMYFSACKKDGSEVTAFILSMMSPAKDLAVKQKKDLGIE
jgi:hypothetical protein